MDDEERFRRRLSEELVAALHGKMSAGDRSDCYAIELLFYPDQNKFQASVEVVAFQETELALFDDYEPDDLEWRWNHAVWTPSGDVATLPETDECCSFQLDWQHGLGCRPYWVPDTYRLADDERDDYFRIAEVVTAAYRDILVQIVAELHRNGTVRELFGQSIPLIISHLEPTVTEAVATVAANGIALTGSFLEYVGGPGATDPEIVAADDRFRAVIGET